MVVDQFPLVAESLARRGWAYHFAGTKDAEILGEMCLLGDLLGTRASGRTGALDELIQPQDSDRAHPRSLSAKYGLKVFPLHIELGHRLRPCRFLLLACMNPGVPSSPTTLLDWRSLSFSPQELLLLESTPILVRAGRRSFYSTILTMERTFFRYDPGCVEPVDERGQVALRMIEERLALSTPEVHQWSRGDLLVIDNWRVLHGRGPSTNYSNRTLARILIDA